MMEQAALWVAALVVALGMALQCVIEDWGQQLVNEKRRLCK